MDANLEIIRMRNEIIETINQHKNGIPIAITVLLLKDILTEAQSQLNSALNDAVKKEKENQSAKCSDDYTKPTSEEIELL